MRSAVRAVLVVALVVLGVACSSGSDDDEEATEPCAEWAVEPVGTGLGALENLLVEDDGGVLLSVADAGEVRRLGPDGEVTTVIGDVPSSGGLATDGTWVYVTTGLTIDAATQGVAGGTIVRFDPQSGDRETWATGLVAPNGLAVLDDGSAVTTRTLSGAGVASEVTRVPGDAPDQLEPLWADLTGTNGAAVDGSGKWLYLSRVAADTAEIVRVSTDDPTDHDVVAALDAGTADILDDLTVTPDDVVYVAGFVSGSVYRVDPATGKTCAIATGLPQVTAVDQRGDGLVAISMDGTVYELTPPN